MTRTMLSRGIACLVIACSLAVGVSASASASSAGILRAFTSYNSKIEAAEGDVARTLDEYKQSKNPAPVQTALDESITVLRALKAKIEAQSAAARRVKEGKRKIVKGLAAVIAAYQKLSTAYGEKGASPGAAQAEATKALTAVKLGRKELLEGVKLLGR